MGIDEVIRPRRNLIRRLAEQHGARNVRVFGSVARGEAGPESDIDLLVEVGLDEPMVPRRTHRGFGGGPQSPGRGGYGARPLS